MPRLPRFVVDAVQMVGSTRIGGALETRAFLGVAKAAAHDFMRIPGVTGVYLTSSWTQPGAAAPGYSDIDLVIAVEVPTLADELELRRRMLATQRRWNSLAMIFENVDYVERRDFETMLRAGNIFWVDADDRFVSLAGESDLVPGRDIHQHKSVERTMSALMRWSRVSRVLIDPTFVRPDPITRRASERLLGGVIADCLEVNPNLPPKHLIALGCAALPTLADFRAPRGDESSRRYALTHTALALGVVEEVCRRFVAATSTTSVVTPAPKGPYESDAFDASVRRAGFAGAVTARLSPPRDPILTFVLADEDPTLAVERLHRTWSSLSLPGGLRPGLLTPPLWAASRLLHPVPDCGAALAHADAPWMSPPELGVREREAVANGRMADLFVRPRGRVFRAQKSAGSALAGLAADVLNMVPMVRAYREGRSFVPLAKLPDVLDETELLAQLRAIIAEERPAMERALGVTKRPA